MPFDSADKGSSHWLLEAPRTSLEAGGGSSGPHVLPSVLLLYAFELLSNVLLEEEVTQVCKTHVKSRVIEEFSPREE